MSTASKKGFTLIELLIVFAIIGILLAIVAVSISESRRKSKNTGVIKQMYEYQNSLELYFTEAGSYPATNFPRTSVYCFGDGLVAGERCLPNSTAYSPAASANIESTFGNYISSLPRTLQYRGSFLYSSPAYSGCVGLGMVNTSCTDKDYSIWFLLEGTNQSCGRAEVANANLSGEYTMCRLMP